MKIQFKKHPLLYTSVFCWLVGFPIGLAVEGNAKSTLASIIYPFTLILLTVPYFLFATWLFILSPISFFKDKRNFLKKKFDLIGWVILVLMLIFFLYSIDYASKQMFATKPNNNVSIPRINTAKCNFDFMVRALNELQETISLTIPEIKFFINQSCKIEIANKEVLKKYKK